MPLSALPSEMVSAILYWSIKARTFGRAMRLRLVNRQFRDIVDELVLHHRMAHGLWITYTTRLPTDNWWPYQTESAKYYHHYCAHHAMLEQSPLAKLGHLRRAAQALCELEGRPADDDDPRDREPTAEDLQVNVLAAAVHLGKTACVERLIAGGLLVPQVTVMPGHNTMVFGHPIKAAGIRGDVEIIKILLGAMAPFVPEYEQFGDSQGVLSTEAEHDRYVFQVLIDETLRHRHRDTYEFFLGNETIACKEAIQIRRSSIPWVDVYKRACSLGFDEELQNMDFGILDPNEDPNVAINNAFFAAQRGSIDMFRHFLRDPFAAEGPHYTEGLIRDLIKERDEPGLRVVLEEFQTGLAGPNLKWKMDLGLSLCEAVMKGRISIVRLLLDYGADPDNADTYKKKEPPIVAAARMERRDMFELLRDRGADLGTGVAEKAMRLIVEGEASPEPSPYEVDMLEEINQGRFTQETLPALPDETDDEDEYDYDLLNFGSQ